MNKALKITIISTITVWAVLATFLFCIVRDLNNEKYEQIQQLEAEIQELKEESEELDVGTIRGIAYQLLFDLVYYQSVLDREYDLNTKIDEKVEQWEMDETEEAQLLAMINVLIEDYKLDN